MSAGGVVGGLLLRPLVSACGRPPPPHVPSRSSLCVSVSRTPSPYKDGCPVSGAHSSDLIFIPSSKAPHVQIQLRGGVLGIGASACEICGDGVQPLTLSSSDKQALLPTGKGWRGLWSMWA